MSLPILHFSDVLCIFAYAAQVRATELQREFNGEIELRYHFCSVYGDAHRKLEERWGERGGVQGYNAHVLEVAKRFPHVTVHPEVWTKSTPRSSLAAHLWLRAVGVAEEKGAAAAGSFERASEQLRSAFFEDAEDVSNAKVQREVSEKLGLDAAALDDALKTGEAHAALANDFELVKQHSVKVSPTLLFNEGRQRLNGNVGFRIIEANVRELLRQVPEEASWC